MDRWSRRRFLGAAAAAGAAWRAGIGADDPRHAAGAKKEPEWRNRNERMRYSHFGRTNFMMSRIAFGMARITPRNVHLVPAALEWGLNYLDTSVWYMNGRSETALGTILGGFRDKVWVTSKAPNIGGFPASHVGRGEGKKAARMYRESIDLTLRRLRTDHVDLYLIHGVNEPWKLHIDEVYGEFLRQRRLGKIRFFGFSTHVGVEPILREAVENCDQYDCIYIAMNPAELERLGPLLRAARKKDIGILACKIAARVRGARGSDPFAPVYGELFGRAPKLNPFQRSYAYILRKASIPGVLCEIDNETKLREDLALPAMPITRSEAEAIEKGVREEAAASCRFCGTCLRTCPKRVAAADVLRAWAYRAFYGKPGEARRLYRAIPPARRGDACRSCARCAVPCRAGFDLRAELPAAHAQLA